MANGNLDSVSVIPRSGEIGPQTLTFYVNNGGNMRVTQASYDQDVSVSVAYEDGTVEAVAHIAPGQFVMLVNLYNHIMRDDIRNGFINPTGKNREE